MGKATLNVVLLIACLMFAGPAWALTLGDNITISDGNFSGTGWHSDREDQEVEPGMQAQQKWDLEGFFLQGNTLSMVGGFDFKNGAQGYPQYPSGDIFIDADGIPVYGDIDRVANGNAEVANTYGYDYVLDLDFGTMTYQVLEIDGSARVKTAYYQENEGSSPWRYVSGGTDTLVGGSFGFQAGLTDSETGFLGGTHYALTGFDLSFLGMDNDFYAHFTMGCGNDNLMGQGETAPVPEPSTFMLLGAGGVLLWRARRKVGRKS